MAHLGRVLCVVLQVAAAMQLLPQTKVHSTVQPVGRTIRSTDPAESVAFLLKYFKVAQEVFSPAQNVTAIALSNFTIRFAQADSNVSKSAVEAMDSVWIRVADSDNDYSEWINFHDGILCHVHEEVMDLDRMSADGVHIYGGGEVRRVRVPATAYTLEVKSYTTSENHRAPDQGSSGGDECRDDSQGMGFVLQPGWFKTTYASHDLAATMDFVTRVLGASQVPDPYPWPPMEGCQAARWFQIPNVVPMLHFVDSSLAYAPERSYNLSSFDAATLAGFAGADDFSYADYNVDDLRVLAALLGEGGDPYFHQDEENACVLYTPMVGTGFVLRAVKHGVTCAASGLADGLCHVRVGQLGKVIF
eukprot:NODE_12943_length_1195_cov_4.498127.p1 GENE.NODE_12943_length_1195_cov_4.498127~~NODE_12943_length_1195_cov_4.498127.p1  ORF type:complete len:360 (-),score=84.15 NODE_12943_length_1195_cov_4.498127:31-1110(-)